MFERLKRSLGRTVARGAMKVAAASAGFGGRPSGLEGARGDRRLRNFKPTREHINSLIIGAGQTVLARSRFLYRNNALAAGMVDCYAGTLVGSGIKASWATRQLKPGDVPPPATAPTDKPPAPAARIKGKTPPPAPAPEPAPAPALPGLGHNNPPEPIEEPWREEIQTLWSDWTDQADADGNFDFEGQLLLGARELFLAGEFFIRLRRRRKNDKDTRGQPLVVPLQLQFMPSEMLDVTDNRTLGNNIVRAGIEFNPIGQRVAYHFWQAHPGDLTETAADRGGKTIVPASEVIHVRLVQEAGQIRGLSKMSPLIVPLFTFDAYWDAECDRKRTAALLTAFVKKGVGDTAQTPLVNEEEQATADEEDSGEARAGMEPGALVVLEYGEDVTLAEPADVGPNFEAFIFRAIAGMASGAGLPYSGISGDPSKSNFANSRTMLVDLRRRFEGVQNSVLIFQLCQAIMPAWLDTAVLADAIKLDGYDDPKKKRDYLRVRWIPDAFEWVDPLKDAQTDLIKVTMRTKARSKVIEEAGDDPIETDHQIAADAAREKQLGIAPAPTLPPGLAAPQGTAPAQDNTGGPNDPANQPGEN